MRSQDAMDDELVEEAILFWDDHVRELEKYDDVCRAVYSEIVEEPLSVRNEFEDEGFLTADGSEPNKGKIAERAGYDASTLSDRPAIGDGEEFDDETSLWEAYKHTGLIEISNRPDEGHCTHRNEVLRQMECDDVIRRRGIPDPATAESEQEAQNLFEMRLMASRFGLHLMDKYAPERLEQYPAEAYPSAYIGLEPREVHVGVNAEIMLSNTPEYISATAKFEKDTRRTTNSQNYWQMVNEITVKLSKVDPVRDMNEIEYYLRKENNRILQSAVSIDDFPGCDCSTIKAHILTAYRQLRIGGGEGPDSDVDIDDTQCPLAEDHEPQVVTDCTEGKVQLSVIYDGIRGGK